MERWSGRRRASGIDSVSCRRATDAKSTLIPAAAAAGDGEGDDDDENKEKFIWSSLSLLPRKVTILSVTLSIITCIQAHKCMRHPLIDRATMTSLLSIIYCQFAAAILWVYIVQRKRDKISK